MEETQLDSESLRKKILGLPEMMEARLGTVSDEPSMEALRAEFYGPRGMVTELCKSIGRMAKEHRPAIGQLINGVREQLIRLVEPVEERLRRSAIAAKLGKRPDPTLSSPCSRAGFRHPLSIVRDRAVEIFRSMGFSIAEATEIETEWHCFDALNMPASHAARDCMDTFYLPDGTDVANVEKHKDGDGKYLLRTHTTSVQIRELKKGNLPLRIIAPGRVFRRDTVDATHSANFHQIDIIHVDRDVSIADLRHTVDFFFRCLLGSGVETRYRPSYFPFTEPSFEVDVRSKNLGKLSNTWIEILGCGMIDPNVFEAVAIDPAAWSGQAWGVGLERIAMLLYGIDDVRHFYRNDCRFLQQFN